MCQVRDRNPDHPVWRQAHHNHSTNAPLCYEIHVSLLLMLTTNMRQLGLFQKKPIRTTLRCLRVKKLTTAAKCCLKINLNEFSHFIATNTKMQYAALKRAVDRIAQTAHVTEAINYVLQFRASVVLYELLHFNVHS
jgi:hypothetical protein